MALTLVWNLTGGVSNSDPNLSLGGEHSSVAVAVPPMNNIFDDVSAAEASTGDTEYRAIDLTNTGSAPITKVAFRFVPTTPMSPSSTLTVGISTSPTNSTQSIASESAAPTNVTFSNPDTTAPLSLPDVPVGGYVRVWFRRVIAANAANIAEDKRSFEVTGA